MGRLYNCQVLAFSHLATDSENLVHDNVIGSHAYA